MRFSSLSLILAAGLLIATPALAGKVSYADGKGKWVPTGCVAPTAPAAMSKNAEAAANDLNSSVSARNAYADAAQAYMACVSKEAQNDAEAFGILITDSAQAILDQTQRSVSSMQVGAKTAK